MLEKFFRSLVILLVSLSLFACASNPHYQPHPKDPLETVNRKIFKFNEGLDKTIGKPVARTYVKYTPKIVRTGVKNFFSNLVDFNSIFNNLFQLKGKETMDSLFRVIFNTTIGFGGTVDVASSLGIPASQTSFGGTLKRWKVGTGPYLMLPIFGPATLRSSTGRVVDYFISPTRLAPVRVRNTIYPLGGLNTRANYLPYTDSFEEVALDKYSMLRHMYLQFEQGAEQEYEDDMDWFDED